MTRLSVNINKIATLRNSRGENSPNVQEVAIDCQRFGAEGITVHPRPDERHIRYSDVYLLKPIVNTEFNIEGYPSEKFIQLILEIIPEQVTLVPDPPNALTSNAGWKVRDNMTFLKKTIARFKKKGIRTSIFVDCDYDNIFMAKESGTDRIELYTEPYAANYKKNRDEAIKDFIKAAKAANQANLGINAGHDLSLENLDFFTANIPNLLEVSIGHALISDALYFGLENTIQMYLRKVRHS